MQIFHVRQQKFVVALDENDAIGIVAAHVAVELGFGLNNALKRAETFKMRFADVGDDAPVGIDDAGKRVDFARMVGAGFNDGEIVFGLDFQQGERHTDVIVEIALREKRVVSRGNHGGSELFRGGFAIGSGDLQDGVLEVLAM